jgi:isocitrate dehydrogenase
MANVPITVAYGDGIGPEIMEASLHILQAAGARIEMETVQVGEKVYLAGNPNGVEPGAWDKILGSKAFYKAPLTTPQGGGFKSVNVTTRKMLGLYANVRPCVAYHPFVDTKYPNMDLVIVRENEEDLYAGIEHRQTDDVYQCLKLITRPGSEKIVRYAFEYARANGRKKVTCFTKDNIMKYTDGLFHRIFDEIGAEYADLEKEHWIVDIGAAKMADTPEAFDVIVLPNLYGDILSDVAAQIAGSVGLAGSANIGEYAAMFEAIHGSAPRRAGQNVANPSGLFLGGVMMMVHIGQPDVAEAAHNAWLRTLEEGIHTYDVYQDGVSRQKVGTREFAEAVVARLGKKPDTLKAVTYSSGDTKVSASNSVRVIPPAHKEMIGVDVFLHWPLSNGNANDLAAKLQTLDGDGLKLNMMSNRGQTVWPNGLPQTFCVDHWRCRYFADTKDAPITHQQIINLLGRVAAAGFDFIKTESLSTFDGVKGFTVGQGEG